MIYLQDEDQMTHYSEENKGEQNPHIKQFIKIFFCLEIIHKLTFFHVLQ